MLHRLGDGRCAGVDGTTEDAGERQHVVDLVRVVAAAGSDDAGVPMCDLRMHLRIRIREREDDRLGRHRRDIGLGDRPAGYSEQNVRIRHGGPE